MLSDRTAVLIKAEIMKSAKKPRNREAKHAAANNFTITEKTRCCCRYQSLIPYVKCIQLITMNHEFWAANSINCEGKWHNIPLVSRRNVVDCY